VKLAAAYVRGTLMQDRAARYAVWCSNHQVDLRSPFLVFQKSRSGPAWRIGLDRPESQRRKEMGCVLPHRAWPCSARQLAGTVFAKQFGQCYGVRNKRALRGHAPSALDLFVWLLPGPKPRPPREAFGAFSNAGSTGRREFRRDSNLFMHPAGSVQAFARSGRTYS